MTISYKNAHTKIGLNFCGSIDRCDSMVKNSIFLRIGRLNGGSKAMRKGYKKATADNLLSAVATPTMNVKR
ncbi:MAG: hypothetical protein VX294_05585 [Candidatus Latescibacterota bacterium]|nr:hypothetical protein [Candidatus Latescibacterota bacterium]